MKTTLFGDLKEGPRSIRSEQVSSGRVTPLAVLVQLPVQAKNRQKIRLECDMRSIALPWAMTQLQKCRNMFVHGALPTIYAIAPQVHGRGTDKAPVVRVMASKAEYKTKQALRVDLNVVGITTIGAGREQRWSAAPHKRVEADLDAAAAGVAWAAKQISTQAEFTAVLSIRPPGHHARPLHVIEEEEGWKGSRQPHEDMDTGAAHTECCDWWSRGFCYRNNVAELATKIMTDDDDTAVVIVDFDAHSGGGTLGWAKETKYSGRVAFVNFAPPAGEYGIYDDIEQSQQELRHIRSVNHASSFLSSSIQHGLETMDWRMANTSAKRLVLLFSAGFDFHQADGILEASDSKGGYPRDVLERVRWSGEDFYRVVRSFVLHQRALNAVSGAGSATVAILEGGYTLTGLAVGGMACAIALEPGTTFVQEHITAINEMDALFTTDVDCGGYLCDKYAGPVVKSPVARAMSAFVYHCEGLYARNPSNERVRSVSFPTTSIGLKTNAAGRHFWGLPPQPLCPCCTERTLSEMSFASGGPSLGCHRCGGNIPMYSSYLSCLSCDNTITQGVVDEPSNRLSRRYHVCERCYGMLSPFKAPAV